MYYPYDYYLSNPYRSLNPYYPGANYDLGQTYLDPRFPIKKPASISAARLALNNEMRTLWEQHDVWTRGVIISIAEGLADEKFVTARLLKNPKDFGAVFGRYYGEAVEKEVSRLITEHLVLAAELVKALKRNDQAAAAEIERKWYANADEMAKAFNSFNPFYSQVGFQRMFHKHLDLVKSQAVARLARNYAADIAAYDEIERQSLEMADHFTRGIVQHFPHHFK